MNKKLLLGLGSLAAAALPVTAVVACGSKDKKETTKKPETKKPTDKKDGQKGEGSSSSSSSSTSGDQTGNGSGNGTDNQAQKVDGAITLKNEAKIGDADVKGSNGAFTISVPNATTVTTAIVKELFTGIGTLTVEDTNTYQSETAGTYTFTIKDPGTNGGSEATATLTVTVEAKKEVEVQGVTSIALTKTNESLQTGLTDKTKSYAPLATGDVTANHPIGPKSNAHFNLLGANAIMNAIFDFADDSKLNEDNTKNALANAQAILKALLLDKTILQNKANAQNLNTQNIAQAFFKELVKDGIDGLANLTTLTSDVLKYEAGDYNGSKVKFILTKDTSNNITVKLTSQEEAAKEKAAKEKAEKEKAAKEKAAKEAQDKETKANADITTAKTAIATLNSKTSTLANHATTSASTLNNATTAEAFGFTKPTDIPADVNVSYAYKASDDSAGTVTITATISKDPGKEVNTEFTLKGFKTTSATATNENPGADPSKQS